jgi:hypothetical protein
MESLNLRTYLTYALMIIRESTIVIWGLALIGLLSAASMLLKDTPIYWSLNTLSVVLSIGATPIFYGIYFELIEDTYSSIGQITRTYVLNYIWLLVRMYLPAIFVATIPLFLIPGAGSGGYFEITLIFFSLIYIYVIPAYYISGRQQGAISTGVIFLLNNLFKSTPIIFTVLLLETLMLLMQFNKDSLPGQDTIYFAILDFLIYLVASIIDFAVFIILIFVLKNSREDTGTEGDG